MNLPVKRIHSLPLVFLLLFLSGILYQPVAGQHAAPPPGTFSNTLGMKFVMIHPGSFMMGSGFQPPEIEGKYGGEAKWYTDEGPQHQVTISKPFFMQTTEVTQCQWKKIMGKNPSIFKNCGNSCPVETVSWHDVKEFITKLNAQETTNKYRLPTEAEWEYACRAESKTAFCFGNQTKMLETYSWYNSNARNWPQKVGQKNPNAWGLYDMHGNVWEWCEDWYNSYPSGSVTDPTGPSLGTHRVSRGGSWRSAPRFCRSAHRYGVDPGYRRATRGFRLVKDP